MAVCGEVVSGLDNQGGRVIIKFESGKQLLITPEANAFIDKDGKIGVNVTLHSDYTGGL